MHKFQQKLTEHMLKNRLSVEQFAKRNGLNKKMLYAYGNGDTMPGVLTAIRLARVLNTTVEEIWG